MPEKDPRSTPLVLAVDVGTSSVRVTAFDAEGRRVPDLAVGEEHTLVTSPDGGAEIDADALVERVQGLLEQLLSRVSDPAVIAGVGVCTFWHSILGVGARGRAVTPIYTWADTRSAPQVAKLRARLDEGAVHARTGCLFHTSYVPAKLLWLAETDPAAFRSVRRWLSPGEYLSLRLFGEPFCSVSMASGTGILDQNRMAWDEELLSVLPIRAEQLSPMVPLTPPARGLVPEAAARLPALRDVPWIPAIGDGAASNLGSGCVAPDRVALMVGTSGALRVVLDQTTVVPPEGLWCYRIDLDRPIVGGALSNGGNLFAWLRDSLRVPGEPDLEAELQAMAPDGHGLTLLPFLAGERAVGWRADARAAIVGLSWSTRPIDILRAGLEAVALRFGRILERLRPLLPDQRAIIASGAGLLRSPTWMQITADALGEPIFASGEPEASSRGVAMLAFEALGLRALRDFPLALGTRVEPDDTRHAIYQEADARQRRLYDLLLVESSAGAAR